MPVVLTEAGSWLAKQQSLSFVQSSQLWVACAISALVLAGLVLALTRLRHRHQTRRSPSSSQLSRPNGSDEDLSMPLPELRAPKFKGVPQSPSSDTSSPHLSVSPGTSARSSVSTSVKVSASSSAAEAILGPAATQATGRPAGTPSNVTRTLQRDGPGMGTALPGWPLSVVPLSPSQQQEMLARVRRQSTLWRTPRETAGMKYVYVKMHSVQELQMPANLRRDLEKVVQASMPKARIFSLAMRNGCVILALGLLLPVIFNDDAEAADDAAAGMDPAQAAAVAAGDEEGAAPALHPLPDPLQDINPPVMAQMAGGGLGRGGGEDASGAGQIGVLAPGPEPTSQWSDSTSSVSSQSHALIANSIMEVATRLIHESNMASMLEDGDMMVVQTPSGLLLCEWRGSRYSAVPGTDSVVQELNAAGFGNCLLLRVHEPLICLPTRPEAARASPETGATEMDDGPPFITPSRGRGRRRGPRGPPATPPPTIAAAVVAASVSQASPGYQLSLRLDLQLPNTCALHGWRAPGHAVLSTESSYPPSSGNGVKAMMLARRVGGEYLPVAVQELPGLEHSEPDRRAAAVLVDLDCEPPTVIRLELWLKLQANGTSGSPEHSSPEPVSDDRSSSVPRGAGSATWSPPRSGDAGGTTTPQEPRSSADSRAARSGQATGVELLVSHVPVVVLPSAWSDAVSELLPHVERMATANDGQTYDHAAGIGTVLDMLEDHYVQLYSTAPRSATRHLPASLTSQPGRPTPAERRNTETQKQSGRAAANGLVEDLGVWLSHVTSHTTDNRSDLPIAVLARLGNNLLLYSVRWSLVTVAARIADTLQDVELRDRSGGGGGSVGATTVRMSSGGATAGPSRRANAAAATAASGDNGAAQQSAWFVRAAAGRVVPVDGRGAVARPAGSAPTRVAYEDTLLHAAASTGEPGVMALVLRWGSLYGGKDWVWEWQRENTTGACPLHVLALLPQASCLAVLSVMSTELTPQQLAAAQVAWRYGTGSLGVTPAQLSGLAARPPPPLPHITDGPASYSAPPRATPPQTHTTTQVPASAPEMQPMHHTTTSVAQPASGAGSAAAAPRDIEGVGTSAGGVSDRRAGEGAGASMQDVELVTAGDSKKPVSTWQLVCEAWSPLESAHYEKWRRGTTLYHLRWTFLVLLTSCTVHFANVTTRHGLHWRPCVLMALFTLPHAVVQLLVGVKGQYDWLPWMGVSHIAMSLANLLRVTAEAAHISALVPGVDDYYMDVLWHWVLVASVDHTRMPQLLVFRNLQGVTQALLYQSMGAPLPILRTVIAQLGSVVITAVCHVRRTVAFQAEQQESAAEPGGEGVRQDGKAVRRAGGKKKRKGSGAGGLRQRKGRR